ncbi:MAG: hypothetical protein HC898_01525 [Phycisphaerales bacterium]|nr:hypothetical protein [Phycisphaerales bacterium]
MYRVRAATDHHVYEMRRVTRFVMLLKQAGALGGAGNQADKQEVETLLSEAGGLMYESHASYSDNAGLGTR